MVLWVLATVAMLLAMGAIVAIADLDDRPQATTTVVGGPVTVDELRAFDARLVARGYEPGRVDALLERAARTIEQLQDRLSAEELEQRRSDEARSLDG